MINKMRSSKIIWVATYKMMTCQIHLEQPKKKFNKFSHSLFQEEVMLSKIGSEDTEQGNTLLIMFHCPTLGAQVFSFPESWYLNWNTYEGCDYYKSFQFKQLREREKNAASLPWGEAAHGLEQRPGHCRHWFQTLEQTCPQHTCCAEPSTVWKRVLWERLHITGKHDIHALKRTFITTWVTTDWNELPHVRRYGQVFTECSWQQVHTSRMLCSLCWGRWQVALSMLVTCLSFSFLEYLCPSTIFHAYNQFVENHEQTMHNSNMTKQAWTQYLHRQIHRPSITSRLQAGPRSILQIVVVSLHEVLNNWHSCSSLINRKSNNKQNNTSRVLLEREW